MRSTLSAVLLLFLIQTALAGTLEEADAAGARGDFALAAKICLELSKQGNPAAQVRLGLMYEAGRGVPRNYPEAVRWYSVASSQGEPLAPYYLGRLFQDRIHEPRHYAKARDWYVVAADRAQSKAAVNLGVMYASGLLGPKNDRIAGLWFLLAAGRADTVAQDNLGVLYWEGRGTSKNYVKAYMWFALAAAQGDPEAAKHRDLIVSAMTAAQLEQGQRLSAEKMDAMCQKVSELLCRGR
jgi:TPR repeat protein